MENKFYYFVILVGFLPLKIINFNKKIKQINRIAVNKYLYTRSAIAS
jgi:hypothetical protein